MRGGSLRRVLGAHGVEVLRLEVKVLPKYRSEGDGQSQFPELAYLRFLKQFLMTLVF